MRERDPAARSTLEVVLLYPGLHALVVHRLAHRLWRAKWRFVARLLSQAGRGLTGIEIHPGPPSGAASSWTTAWGSSSGRPPRSATT